MQALKTELEAVGQAAVRVREVERAVAFYRDALGLPFLFQAGPGLAFFQCGATRLMLTLPESAEFDHPSSILYFTVADIGAAHEALSARGVAFRDAPHKVADLGTREVWMTFFDDGEGNVMALTSEVEKA